ncbi:MAG: sialidase [Gemmatimonadaceae bacterium]
MLVRPHLIRCFVVFALSFLLATTIQAQADSAALAQLRYRYIGPVGNRVSSVAGIPGDPNVYYAGAASGGIWKTTDGGIHWAPIFDSQDVSSIGALAVAPSNPNIVWAGTGEPFIRSHISIGNGVYKSTDAGRTWSRMGLEQSGRIGRFAIDPRNPDIVFVAAQGHSYGPQQERGIYRTTDGGKTWTRVLFVDPNTGGIDVVMNPTNSQTLFAAMWQLEMHTWSRESGGPGSGLFVSHDGGTTWTKLKGNGLPTHTIGKIGLAFAQSNPNRLYALIETGDGVPLHGQPTDNGELWRSDDGGSTWKVVSYDRNLACRQPYYTRMAVSTDNPDEAYFLCATFSRTLDGGVTNSAAGFGGAVGGGPAAPAARVPADSANLRAPALTTPGGDNHDMWIDPTNANRMAVANDGQVAISTTRGRTWLRVNLPIAQIYHATVDNRIPYYVYGNKQDGPSYRGPSNSRTGNTIARSEWHSVDGGESGWATPDPVDSNLVWSTASGSGSRGGIVIRFDERTRQSQNVEVYPLSTGGHAAADLKYRFVWDAPFLISPNDHNRVYIGSQFVHMTTNGGRSWQVISPDLTRNDKSKQQMSGGLTPDNIGVEYGGVIYAIAESRAQSGLIWTGSNDGLVHVTRDAGKTWTDVTKNIPGIPMWGSVRHIEPSRYDAGSAYLIVDGHQENNRDPWVYRTKDFGKTWKLIVTGIPKSPLSYAHIIREDPVRRGLLYLGTENALYTSFDDGDHWQPLQLNLPHSPVYGLVIQEKFNDLVIATYGRGFWILDDLSPLQNATPELTSSTAQLLKPRAAYRWVDISGNVSTNDDPTAGTNPPYGAAINYWLKTAHPDTGAVRLEILDTNGKSVRTFRGTGRAGINRVYWNLRNDSSKVARLRTKPTYDAEFEMNRDSTRVAPGIGRLSVLMPPGAYTVKLTVDGQSYTQALQVLKDPNDPVTDQDIAASTSTLLALQTDLSAVSDMLGTIESLRSQIQHLGATGEARNRSDAFEQKLMAIEGSIVDLRMTGRGQDEVRYPVMIGGQLAYLAGGVAASDFTPTNQQKEVQQILENQLKETRTALDHLIQTDLPSFNSDLRAKGIKELEAR